MEGGSLESIKRCIAIKSKGEIEADRARVIGDGRRPGRGPRADAASAASRCASAGPMGDRVAKGDTVVEAASLCPYRAGSSTRRVVAIRGGGAEWGREEKEGTAE